MQPSLRLERLCLKKRRRGISNESLPEWSRTTCGNLDASTIWAPRCQTRPAGFTETTRLRFLLGRWAAGRRSWPRPKPAKPKCILDSRGCCVSPVAGLALTTRHLSGFPWGPPPQDPGRCSTRCLLEFQAGGIHRADGTTAMAVAPPPVCVLISGLSWVP